MTHLFPLEEGFALWRWICVRGAGFPAREIERFAAPELARAVDGLLAERALLRDALAEVAARVSAAAEASEGAVRRGLIRVAKSLRAGSLPAKAGELDALPELAPVLSASVLSACADRQVAIAAREQEIARLFEAARRRVSGELKAELRDPRFRAAMIWQNRAALEVSDTLLADPVERNDSKTRRRELTVASYVQRYRMKNDSIGFFGPIGWGELARGGVAVLAQHPGPSLCATRTVYFERWTIDALAEALSSDPRILEHVAPRRAPWVRVEGNTLHHPIERTSELPPAAARLLAGADGVRTAGELARDVLASGELEESSEDELYEWLADLAEKKLLTWTLELPPADEHPEASLRALLLRISDPGLAAEALGKLDALEGRRSAVAAASSAGEPDLLDRSMISMEQSFTELTGQASTRLGGQAYAGRTLVFEDCRRDLQLSIGPDLLARMARPLGLLLCSARWYTHEIAARYRVELEAIYRALVEERGTAAIDYLRFWERVPALFPGREAGRPSIVRAVVEALKSRWWSLLGVGAEASEVVRRVARSSAELEAGVRAAFAAPRPGWPAARHHSPDLLLDAVSEAAIARGEVQFVLGELHTSINTLVNPMFAKEYPRPEELIAAKEVDIPFPCIAPVWSKARTRADYYSLARHDVDLEQGSTRSSRPRAQVVAAAELRVEEVEGFLVVRTRDRRFSFDIIAFLEHHLIAESHSRFVLTPAMKHAPRIAIDDLVISREQWTFAPEELPFIGIDDGLRRFEAARALVRALGLPRFVFFKTPEEPKPVYADLESPLFVELFAKLARQASSIVVSEMLPAPGETWLVDAEGRTYASELRACAVDPEPWRAERTKPGR